MNAIANNLTDQAVATGVKGIFDPPSTEINLSDVKPMVIRGLEVAMTIAGQRDQFDDFSIEFSCEQLTDLCQNALLSPNLNEVDRLPVLVAHEAFQATLLMDRSTVRDEARRKFGHSLPDTVLGANGATAQ